MYLKCRYNIVSAMRTALDIPDATYRRINARSAEERRTARSTTLVIYSQWLGDSQLQERRGPPRRRRPHFRAKKSFHRLPEAEEIS